jgi:2-polyprenyl-3-methyl-5-hydroxy-6-metoxy-1,4-benzoquinol methylase
MAEYFHKSMQLSEGQLHPPDAACPICRSNDRSQVFRIQTMPVVWLLRCRRCHVCSASRMPTDQALERYYSSYYSRSRKSPHETVEMGNKITFDRPERLVTNILSGLTNSFEGRCLNILDFGGGDGTVSLSLCKALLEKNACKEARIRLVDLSNQIPREESSQVLVERRTHLENDGQLYDLVIASAILEHIPYPAGVLRELLASLRVGGVFYARTPFVVPLLRVLPLPRFRRLLFTYPAHVHDMGQDFWQNILKEIGLSSAYRVARSRPSIVERSIGDDFLRALAAHVLKAPWYLFGRHYGLVGGWEIFIEHSDA